MYSILIPLLSLGLITAGQRLLGENPILLNGDLAVLESPEQRNDLACAVSRGKAKLGFDLTFHSRYSVAIPMRELEGTGNTLSVVFRVTPKDGEREPVYFTHRINVPAIEDKKGSVTFDGGFELGEGSYRVDWLMHEAGGPFCSAHWDVEAALESRDKHAALAVTLPAGAVEASSGEEFQAEPPVDRSQDGGALSVKVLMNFAPHRAGAAALDPMDRVALISILRDISRNPQIRKISLVAFNIQEQKILYRQDSVDYIDFPALGRALEKLTLGTVKVSQLEKKHAATEFLSELVKSETANAKPDGLIFVGPKALLGSNVPEDDLKQIGELGYPVFYLNYAPDPREIPGKDTIGRMVEFFKGREYTIGVPRDLWNAEIDVAARISILKQARIDPRAALR